LERNLRGARSAWLAVVLAVFAVGAGAGPAMAASHTRSDTSGCSPYTLSQPFTGGQDFNWYAYVPGQSADSFGGAGWTLSGGASISPTTLADGQNGTVLNLPNGATAVSPVMCVSPDYQQARAEIRSLTPHASGGVNVSVTYQGSNPQNVGNLGGNNAADTSWGASNTVNLQSGHQSGWQLVQITLSSSSQTSTGTGQGFQVYNLAAQASAGAALASVDTSACSTHHLSQLLMAERDFNWYAIAPGESPDNFAGTGWTLSHGATIVKTQLADGQTGSVLNLPGGATAVSPLMCVNSDYPQALAQIRNLTQGSTGGLTLGAAIDGTTSWNNPHTSNLGGGGNTAWTESGGAGIQPANASGWQLVQFTLTSSTSGHGYQLYDLGAQADTALSLASVNTSACSRHPVSQPFAAGGDFNWYSYAPGVASDNFGGGGWKLSGGAQLVSSQLADGHTGSVLDLPVGSSAVSSLMCISSDYQLARAEIRSLTGGGGANITLGAAIDGTTTWNNPHTSNLATNSAAWSLTPTANLQPANASGWQLVRLTLTNTGSSGEFQLYDLAAQADSTVALSSVNTSMCSQQPLSQPFLAGSDTNWYATVPGQQTDSFYGTGWKLTGGARVVPSQLADGATGGVLQLPAGAQATSPVMCVSTDFPEARAQVRSLTGGGSVGLYVSYDGTTSWRNPQHVGDLNAGNEGWALPNATNLNPPGYSGYELVQFTLIGNQDANNPRVYQVYNLSAQADATLAEESVDTSACVPPTLSQSFLSYGDQNWYTPTPGESAAGFTGTGWTLSGGASVVTTQLPGGATGPVLNLPSGAKAVSPVMCVTSAYPSARAVMRTVSGDGNIGMYVAYQGTTSWNNPQHSGDLGGTNTAWGASGSGNIQPGKYSGWQLVQITLTGNGTGKVVQVFDFEIDPRKMN
jgi:hypothetical protein